MFFILYESNVSWASEVTIRLSLNFKCNTNKTCVSSERLQSSCLNWCHTRLRIRFRIYILISKTDFANVSLLKLLVEPFTLECNQTVTILGFKTLTSFHIYVKISELLDSCTTLTSMFIGVSRWLNFNFWMKSSFLVTGRTVATYL